MRFGQSQVLQTALYKYVALPLVRVNWKIKDPKCVTRCGRLMCPSLHQHCRLRFDETLESYYNITMC